MSLLGVRRGSRFSCVPLPSRVVLLGSLMLLYVACHFRFSILVSLDACLFGPCAAAINSANAMLLSLSGEDDGPLGSWDASHFIPVSTDRQSAASMQQLTEVLGGEFHSDREYEREVEQGRGNRARGQRLLTVSPASLQQMVTLHDNNTPHETRKHQKAQLENQVRTGSRQTHGIFNQHHFQQPKMGLVTLHQRRQEASPHHYEDLSHYLKLRDGLAGDQRWQSFRPAAYIQSVETPIAQQQQHRDQLLQGNIPPQQGKSRVATNGMMLRRAVSRPQEKNVRPVFASIEEEGDELGGAKMRKGPFSLEAGRTSEMLEATDGASQRPSTRVRDNFLVATQHIPPYLGREGKKEALLQMREKDRGIGTILAGAGLSTLLGGLNQYQQGPLAAGPPGSAVPQPGGLPVAPGALTPATAASAVSPVSASPFAAPAATNPFAAAAATPDVQPSSGHSIIPITVGIILGLIVLCLIGGCAFKIMKKKKRR